MRGSDWVRALHKAGELSEVLCTNWKSATGQHLRPEEDAGWLVFFRYLSLIFLGLAIGFGVYGFTRIPDPMAGACLGLAAGSTLLAALMLFIILQKNEADKFFEKLKAARDIWQLGGFETIAKLELGQLKKRSEVMLDAQAVRVRELEVELGDLNRDSCLRDAKDKERMAARAEFDRMLGIFKDLSTSDGSEKPHFQRADETLRRRKSNLQSLMDEPSDPAHNP